MNALTLAMIISMLLTTGNSGNPDAAMKKQQEETLAAAKDKVDGSLWASLIGGATASVDGHNLNHNETIVRDPAPDQQTNSWSVLLNGEPAVTVGPLLSQFLFYRVGAGCSPWVCGSNHNETLVHETAYQRPNAGRSWLTPEQAETVAPVLIQLSPTGVVCSPLVCRSNHHETFLSDVQ